MTEPKVSVWCGVPTLLFALVAVVLLGSYLTGRALGPPAFYTTEEVRRVENDVNGRSLGDVWHKCYVPSMLFLSCLLMNSCVAGLGIYLSRRRWIDRPIRTSATALILNTMAFILVWMLWVQAAW
jgi:hypothetical protein